MLLGYVGYYLGRQNLSAAIPLLEEAFGYTNTDLAGIVAISELAYAVGKFVNGPLGDKLGGKKIFLLGLAGTVVFNVLFALSESMGGAVGVSTLTMFVAVWCCCRYSLSMGWGGIAKTIGAWYPPERNGTIMGWISINFQFGGVAATMFALEDVITTQNANNLKCKVIVECANGPVTPNADAILREKKIMVIPDILANAGGVAVSYFEWIQNKNGFYWSVEEVHERLRTMMVREFKNVYERYRQQKLDMRTAAYAHALERLGEAIEALGTHAFYSGNGGHV